MNIIKLANKHGVTLEVLVEHEMTFERDRMVRIAIISKGGIEIKITDHKDKEIKKAIKYINRQVK